jgi:hypothetical protein
MRCRKKSPKKSPKPKRTPARVPGGYIPQATPTCNSDQEWFVDKCYKKCKPNQKRSPKTRRCQSPLVDRRAIYEKGEFKIKRVSKFPKFSNEKWEKMCSRDGSGVSKGYTESQSTKSGTFTYVGTKGNKDVKAFALCKTLKNNTIEIIVICAEPGFGGLLIDGIQEMERQRGTDNIALCALKDPYGFYRKFGWVDIAKSNCKKYGISNCPVDIGICSYMIKNIQGKTSFRDGKTSQWRHDYNKKKIIQNSKAKEHFKLTPKEIDAIIRNFHLEDIETADDYTNQLRLFLEIENLTKKERHIIDDLSKKLVMVSN